MMYCDVREIYSSYWLDIYQFVMSPCRNIYLFQLAYYLDVWRLTSTLYMNVISESFWYGSAQHIYTSDANARVKRYSIHFSWTLYSIIIPLKYTFLNHELRYSLDSSPLYLYSPFHLDYSCWVCLLWVAYVKMH